MAGVSWWLLESLRDAQELAERAVVETTVRNMRTGLMLAAGSAAIAGRDSDLRQWEGQNPIRWLAPASQDYLDNRPVDAAWLAANSSGLPAGYQGNCQSGRGELAKGSWCYDQASKELVYRPRHSRYLRVQGWPATEGDKVLRWKVVLPADAKKTRGFIGVRVEEVTPYVWRAE